MLFIFLFFSLALFAQNAKNMHHAHPYRGTRTGNTDALFYVTKIDDKAGEEYISTVRGAGYVMRDTSDEN